jgi:hypothetical protein
MDTAPDRSPSRPDHAAVQHRLERFARWSDDVFRVPGTSWRVGLEPLVGLLPGVGDAAGLIVAAYVPVEAWRLGAPWRLLGRMGVNIAVDALVGTVPLLGDVFDLGFKANRRNVTLLTGWLEADASPDATRPPDASPPAPTGGAPSPPNGANPRSGDDA